MKIIHVVGARPNFMKAAPLIEALGAYPWAEQVLVHTGQHYDPNMSAVFFRQLGMPEPDVNLGVGSGTHAAQTAGVMVGFESFLEGAGLGRRGGPAGLLLVYGDVNSTIATALVAAKAGLPVGHVEAGLRSGDRRMPEEINRVLTDRIADLHLTPSEDADANLRREGADPAGIHRVGNLMIDTLVRLLGRAERPADLPGIGGGGGYALVTLHRPSNVDEPAALERVVGLLKDLGARLPVVFPVHPRTRARLAEGGLTGPGGAGAGAANVHLVEPQGYLQFLWLQRNATVVVTDSGGVQEETTYLRVPCLTLRENTERPVTCSLGTNRLVGHDNAAALAAVDRILAGEPAGGEVPPLWDGRAGGRAAAVIAGRFGLA